MKNLTLRSLAAMMIISLSAACGGDQAVALPMASAPPIAAAPLQGPEFAAASAPPAAQASMQGPADLADLYRTEAAERGHQAGGAETASYPQVPATAMVVADASPREALGTALGVVVR
jgi:hypothetical protein